MFGYLRFYKCAVSPIHTPLPCLRGAQELIGNFPIIIRPAFTLGGTGGGIAYNMDEFKEIVKRGIDASMTNQVLVEKSLVRHDTISTSRLSL